MDNDTLNICIGHKPFPSRMANVIDVHLSPKPIFNFESAIIIPDEQFGPYGDALSEYCQLFWLMRNLDRFPHVGFFRILQYRRFVSKIDTGHSVLNAAWLKGVRESELESFSFDFSRISGGELMNRPFLFPVSVFCQYASAHHAEDFVSFAAYLASEQILSETELVDFFNECLMIPASSIGVFSRNNLVADLRILEVASHFMHTSFFRRRQGYQRRNMGFLLERLHSFLILRSVRNGLRKSSFGFNKLISEDDFCSNTTEI
jgi:hypothetical protein